MDYNERFNSKIVYSKKFSRENASTSESEMIIWINDNINDIDIIQVYTALDNRYFRASSEVRTNFYCMYKYKEKPKKKMI